MIGIIGLIILLIIGIDKLISIIAEKFPSGKRQAKLIDKMQKILEEDKKERDFNRQNYDEAFADNFARMYGYGAPLMSGLQKCSISFDNNVKSWFKYERERENYIFRMTMDMLSDEHKTNLHRIKSLLDEYNADINDPNIPAEVKVMLQNDVNELKLILNKYLNNMSEFQNKVNKAIADSLNLLDDEGNNSDEPQDDQSSENPNNPVPATESYFKELTGWRLDDFLRSTIQGQMRVYGYPLTSEQISESGYLFNTDNVFTESKKAYERMMKEINAVTQTERNEFYKLFGKSNECSLAKDKDGYYVRTHRARSKSYPEIKNIPKKDVKFVRSTS